MGSQALWVSKASVLPKEEKAAQKNKGVTEQRMLWTVTSQGGSLIESDSFLASGVSGFIFW